ncbi:MAG TPA: DUF6766 family protein [Flavisolibacter sp.]|jgi:hypothetical protein
MKLFFRNNGLSIVFFLLFIISLVGQAVTGLKEHNGELEEEGGQQLSMMQYLSSGHFLQATFENWESEFLQMALFVTLSISLYQKGSSESKDPDAEEEVDRDPDPSRKDAPGPVQRGGWMSNLYSHSLCYTLWLLFLLSFLMHWRGSLIYYNEEQVLKGGATEGYLQYLSNSRFWFESFQNWQSEYLSVFAVIVLTIFLREKGSPQSKPVDAPHSETGG